MRTFADVISLWPTAAEFAADLSISPVRARAWKNRNSIPSSMWNKVVESAQRRGFDVTVALLADLADGSAAVGDPSSEAA